MNAIYGGASVRWYRYVRSVRQDLTKYNNVALTDKGYKFTWKFNINIERIE